MQFRVNKISILDVLSNLIGIVPTKTTLQILTNFIFSLKGEDLSICATDLDISMETTLKVKGEGDGEIAINARKLYEIVRELPEGNTAFEVSNQVLQITSEKGFTCKLAGADTADFPKAPQVEAALDLAVPSHVIRTMVEKTAFAVSLDTTRLSLNGICWDIRDKEMIMVATDGHKLGYCAFKHNLNAKGGKNLILSSKATALLCRLLSEKEISEVRISIGASYVAFTAGLSTITSKMLQGPYPNYEQVIPKSNNKRATIETEIMASAIRRVSILSSVKTHQVKFSFQKDRLELSAVNRDFGGEAKEEISASYAAESIDIGFNAVFFLEILKLIEAPRVRLSMNSSISACLFHPECEDKSEADFFFLLMPLRLLNE